MGVLLWILRLIWFFLPAGLANMSPVLVRQRWLGLAAPIDGGAILWNQPLFGRNKTWRGLIAGTILGGGLFTLQKLAATLDPTHWQIGVYSYDVFPWWFGFGFAAAALLSDLLKSFFKRRFRIPPGQTWFPFDQVDYLIGPTLLATFYAHVDALSWVIILSLGIIFHVGVNRIGYRLHLKNTPW